MISMVSKKRNFCNPINSIFEFEKRRLKREVERRNVHQRPFLNGTLLIKKKNFKVKVPISSLKREKMPFFLDFSAINFITSPQWINFAFGFFVSISPGNK